jgi:hypothetical protein
MPVHSAALLWAGEGTGGAALAGNVAGTAFNGSTPNDGVAADGASLIDIDTVIMRASASGGVGGTNLSGVGQAGGRAEGGQAFLNAEAISGALDITSATIQVTATGGRGGAGAANATGAGGAGGNGGSAAGGFVNAGQVSGPTDTPGAPKNGIATFGTLNINTSASGGLGGASGNGTVAGVGGSGGNAVGGAGAVLARGGRLNANSVAITSIGQGGAGGANILNGQASGFGTVGRGAGGTASAFFTTFFDISANMATNVGSAVNITQLGLNASGRRIASQTGTSGTVAPDQFGDSTVELIGSTANIGTFGLTVGGVAPRDSALLGFAAGGTAVSPTATPSVIRANGGDLILSAGDGGAVTNVDGDLNLQAIGTGRIGGLGSVLFDAGGTIAITHENAAANAVAVIAPNLSFTSPDIEVGGVIEGDLVSLNAVARGQTVVIGGTTEGPGYTLTQSEIGRIEANQVSFVATDEDDMGERPAQVLVRDLTIIGSGENDGVSIVSLFSAGSIRVEGIVDFLDAAPTDILELAASDRIEVITPSGAVRMSDPTGTRATGNLLLDSPNIVVADASLAAQLKADPNFAGRTRRCAPIPGQ